MFRLDDPENSRRVVSDISPNQTWTTVFNAPPNADVGAHICIETERYFGPTSAVVCIECDAIRINICLLPFRFNFLLERVAQVLLVIYELCPTLAIAYFCSGIHQRKRTE